MGKANEINKMADVIEATEFTSGDNVKFKDGHQLAGTLGKVSAINPDGTITVMVGKAVQPPVSPSELELVDYGAQNKVGGEPQVDAPDANPTA
jgi:transcription antitermination factor NusG